jgi:hypothetical protein
MIRLSDRQVWAAQMVGLPVSRRTLAQTKPVTSRQLAHLCALRDSVHAQMAKPIQRLILMLKESIQ